MSAQGYYYDAGCGWRDEDDTSWIDEREEDRPVVSPDEPDDRLPARSRGDDEPPRKRAEDGTSDDPADPLDPMDDPDFREAAQAHRDLSGRVVSHGRRRVRNTTGNRGQGMRGRRGIIMPGGRSLGAPAPVPGKPSLNDSPFVLQYMLGKPRIRRLRKALLRRGMPTKPERYDRAYLALLLRTIAGTKANQAAAELLLDGASEKALRKIGDLRRREYPTDVMEHAWESLSVRLAEFVALDARQKEHDPVASRIRTEKTTVVEECDWCGQIMFFIDASDALYWLRTHGCVSDTRRDAFNP